MKKERGELNKQYQDLVEAKQKLTRKVEKLTEHNYHLVNMALRPVADAKIKFLGYAFADGMLQLQYCQTLSIERKPTVVQVYGDFLEGFRFGDVANIGYTSDRIAMQGEEGGIGVVITPATDAKEIEVTEPNLRFGEGHIIEYNQSVKTKEGRGVYMYGDLLTSYNYSFTGVMVKPQVAPKDVKALSSLTVVAYTPPDEEKKQPQHFQVVAHTKRVEHLRAEHHHYDCDLADTLTKLFAKGWLYCRNWCTLNFNGQKGMEGLPT